nr:ribonuclease H-like domain-containing protein [Tanacetum cinerariifolium]
KPTEKHLKEVKRIFCYLRRTVNMGLWYMKDSGFELTGFSDVDYAGCKDSFKSTSGGAQFLDTFKSTSGRAQFLAEKLDHVEKGTIELYFVKTDYQLANIFTKALPADRFNYLVRRLGMRNLSLQELERLEKSQFQVTPKLLHLHAVKRIFRYLKGQPKLRLWYPRDSLFDLEACSDSDYAGANLDRKSAPRGC